MPALATGSWAILIAPLFVLLFTWLCMAIGWRLLALLGASDNATPAERLVVATALGAGVLQFVPFALGSFGQLGVTSMRVATLVIAALCGFDLRLTLRQVIASLRALKKPDVFTRLWLLALVPAALMAFLLAVGPSLDADGLAYHLTLPKRWLHAGSLSYVPSYPHGNSTMGGEMVFTFGLVFGGDAAAKLTHVAFGLVGAAGLYLAGRRLSGPIVGALAATLYLVGPLGVIGLLGWGYLEGVTGLAIIASTLAWIVWQREQNVGWLRCAFLAAGFSVAFKLTSALFPAGLTALTFVALSIERKSWKPALVELGRSLLPLALLPILPWLIRATSLTGNPLFPLFAKLIPSRDFSPVVAAALEQNQRYFIWGTGRAAVLTLEQRKMVLGATAACACLLALVALWRTRGALARGVTFVLLFATLAQLSAVGLYQRYYIPLFAVAQLPLLTWLASYLVKHGKLVVLGAALLGSLVQSKRMLDSVGKDVVGLALGSFSLEQRRAFLARQLPLFPMYEQANRDLPPGARVLLASSCGGFYFDRTTYCGEFFQDALRMSTWPEFKSDISMLGVTHIAAPRKWADGSTGPQVNFRDHEDVLVGRLIGAPKARLVASASDQGVYEIDAGSLLVP